MISGKCWGTSELIFKNDNFEVHRITIKKDHYCSKHKHLYKHNIFYVESGLLQIDVHKNDYDLIDTTVLKAGERTDVPPHENHKFIALDNTVAFEIYYSQPIGADIVRENCGGNINNKKYKLKHTNMTDKQMTKLKKMSIT